MQALSSMHTAYRLSTSPLPFPVKTSFGAKPPLTWEVVDRRIAEAAHERCQQFRQSNRAMIRNAILRAAGLLGVPVAILTGALVFHKQPEQHNPTAPGVTSPAESKSASSTPEKPPKQQPAHK